MKQMLIKILDKGDVLIDYRPERIIVRNKRNEYLIYEIMEVDGYPRVNVDRVVKITQGIGVIEFFDSESQITIRP